MKKPGCVDASRVSLSRLVLIAAASEVTPARVANLGCRPDSTRDRLGCSWQPSSPPCPPLKLNSGYG
jgi:hypothetical protein